MSADWEAPGAETSQRFVPQPGDEREATHAPAHLEVLTRGSFESCEQIRWGSNYTFWVALRHGADQLLAVYKPRQGERPLWDFPQGTLYLREYAAYVTSQALGWPFVPLTIVREGPYGIGSLQLFVEAEPFPSIKALETLEDLDLTRIAVFDQLTNNADRKGGHVLRDAAGKLWAIDHGLCFGTIARVRTVLQQYCGQPVPSVVLDELRAFLDADGLERLCHSLDAVIAVDEYEAFSRRLERLLEDGVFPRLDYYRSVPWPPF